MQAATTTAASASSSRHVRSDVAVLIDLDGVVIDSRAHGCANLAERKEQLFRAAARANLELLDGVRDLLSFLDDERIAKTVVTSAPQANLDVVVETLDIGGHFQVLIAEEDATHGKRHPEGLLVAASA